MLLFLLVCYALLSEGVSLLVVTNLRYNRNDDLVSDPHVRFEHKDCLY
jgi:hypothetical protein